MSGGAIPHFPWYLAGPLTWTGKCVSVMGHALTRREREERYKFEQRIQYEKFGRIKPKIRIRAPSKFD